MAAVVGEGVEEGGLVLPALRPRAGALRRAGALVALVVARRLLAAAGRALGVAAAGLAWGVAAGVLVPLAGAGEADPGLAVEAAGVGRGVGEAMGAGRGETTDGRVGLSRRVPRSR